jgi:hypothetical protein
MSTAVLVYVFLIKKSNYARWEADSSIASWVVKDNRLYGSSLKYIK